MTTATLQNIQEFMTQNHTQQRQSQALTDLIIPGGTLKSSQQALEVYARAYHATLTEALGENFEGVWSVVGDDNFFALCDDYIRENPSHSYNLSDYGHHFPYYLAQRAESKNLPFLADLARFEWIFKEIFHSEKTEESNIHISPDLPLRFSSSTQIFSSDFSVYQLWENRKQQLDSMPDSVFQPQRLLLYKDKAHKIWVQTLEDWEFAILSLLKDGKSISSSLSQVIDSIGIPDESKLQNFFYNLAKIISH